VRKPGHHGADCSFVSIMKKHNLKDKALFALAEAVNAADRGVLDSNAYARGLEADTRGYSLMYPDNRVNKTNQGYKRAKKGHLIG
jgi:hypothetical protein